MPVRDVGENLAFQFIPIGQNSEGTANLFHKLEECDEYQPVSVESFCLSVIPPPSTS